MTPDDRIIYKNRSFVNIIYEEEIIKINPKKSDVFLELL